MGHVFMDTLMDASLRTRENPLRLSTTTIYETTNTFVKTKHLGMPTLYYYHLLVKGLTSRDH